MRFRTRVEEAPTEERLRELVARARDEGAGEVLLETTHEAGDAWLRVGFSEVARVLVAPVDTLEQRLAGAREASFGSIHVQSDDVDAVVRAVRQFVPRLPGGSGGSVVVPPREGWTAVYDELCDREPEMLRRLARELSDRMGAVVVALGLEEGAAVRYIAYERGRIVDEYLSVPEYHGPLPPGDVVALGANPRVMARLTGADPEDVRRAAPTAASTADLAPGPELLADLAAVLGIEGGDHGYVAAVEIPGAARIAR